MKTIRTGTLALAVMAATSAQASAQGEKSKDEEAKTLAPETSRQPQDRPRNRPVTQPFARGSAQPKAPRRYAQAQVASNSPASASTVPDETNALTAKEVAAFRNSIRSCWTTAGLSEEAQGISLTVGFSLDPDGKPDQTSLTLVDASEASDEAITMAFRAASRAILRCGADGFGLPKDKYAQWRDIELVFTPERMSSQ